MVYGYRVGRFAYLTDVSRIPEATFAQLDDLDVLVLDALRPESHPTHFSFDEAVSVAQQIGARQTYFIHMTHNVRHADADASLPAGINLAHDGLTVCVDG
jgi:phosphoribosyl 1,2-cyclic phosphate phosphodiesterase